MVEYVPGFEIVDDFDGRMYLFEPEVRAPRIWKADKDSEDETSDWDLFTHSPEQGKGKRNILYVVVRDLNY